MAIAETKFIPWQYPILGNTLAIELSTLYNLAYLCNYLPWLSFFKILHTRICSINIFFNLVMVLAFASTQFVVVYAGEFRHADFYAKVPPKLHSGDCINSLIIM